MTTYSWLKLVHVLSAIVAVGTNITYFVWFSFAKKQEASTQSFVLGGVRSLDRWLANPAYIVLPATGIAMVIVGNIGFGTFWISASLGLFVFMGAFAGMFFSPSLRRWSEIVEAEGTGSTAYTRAVKRTTVTGAITMVPIAAILYFMLMKPTL